MVVNIKINGIEVQAEDGMTVLEAADKAEIYIPRLCHHPSLGSSAGAKPVDVVYRGGQEFRNDGATEEFEGCGLCLFVSPGSDALLKACETVVSEGLIVETEAEPVKKQRIDNLAIFLKDHPHACLLCAQQEGCSRTQCSTNVPEDERCCPQLGNCEVQKVAGYVGVKPDIQKYVPRGLPKITDEPLFERDYNLCLSCLRCVRACRDLRGVEALGFVFQDGELIVGPTSPEGFKEADCHFCGACVEVCPTGALTDKDLPPGDREEVLLPCVSACPGGVDIPRYIDLIKKGNYAEANAVIREKVPMPGILGMVCFHPCEDACRRSELNEPMSICGLKRFSYEQGYDPLQPVSKESTGKKVAVVGGGPAGLSAAYYLSLAGHGVTIYEGEEKLGGMLRYAIPDYRLPQEVVDNELKVLTDIGVEFMTGTRIGAEIPIEDLKDNFDAVYIATGAGKSKRIPLEGSEMDGVLWGIEFLKSVKKDEIGTISGNVVVIGGGNVAMDVARTAIRFGASDVRIACLESRDIMPAWEWEIDEALEEGVVLNTSWGPSKITGDEKATGIELKKCTSVFDAQGNFAPAYDEAETKTLPADMIILAIGQDADISYAKDLNLKTEKGCVVIDSITCCSSEPGLFAGGEAVTGPASVVQAMADGSSAAGAIDKFLGGTGEIVEPLVAPEEADPFIGKMEQFAEMGKVKPSKASMDERKSSFCLVENCLSEEEATEEASRCLRCDLRLQLIPVTLPPEKWLELTRENVETVPDTEGVYQLLNENKEVIVIQGTQTLKSDLQGKLDQEDSNAKFFMFDEDPMYSKRESELIQQYLQQFGKMPEGDGGDDDMDDLF